MLISIVNKCMYILLTRVSEHSNSFFFHGLAWTVLTLRLKLYFTLFAWLGITIKKVVNIACHAFHIPFAVVLQAMPRMLWADVLVVLAVFVNKSHNDMNNVFIFSCFLI